MITFLFLFFSLALPAQAADTYVCPMHCEGKKTYEKPGKCPVCGMDLEKTGGEGGSGPLNSRDYRVDITADKPQPKANEPVTLTFSPRRTKDNTPIAELGGVRVSAVSQDLSWFEHQLPEAAANGDYRAKVAFPAAGNYVLFVELTPKGEKKQVFPLAFQVPLKNPDDKPREKPLKPGTSWKGEGYEVTVKLSPAPKAGQSTAIEYTVKKGGKKVADLDPGHAVVVSEDTTKFVEAHRSHGEPGASYRAVFPSAGLYKMWAQLQLSGKTITPGFVVKVGP